MITGDVAGSIGIAVALGVVAPWVMMRMLRPALSDTPGTMNYRGASIHYGLGVVWLIWAGCAILGGIGVTLVSGESVPAILTLAGPLALVAFAMGIVDDAYGSGSARGFRGHLKAMMQGRLTTGGLKLVGIGVASLVVSAAMVRVAPWGRGLAVHGAGVREWTVIALVVALSGAGIALTSNFVNLTDLRPGRALKAYTVLAVAGVASAVLALGRSNPLLDAAVLGLFAAGPVLAVWSDDVGERGMLGDAGANPMGAVAGLLIVSGLPLWGLAAFAALMLGLNLASERVSYSAVIEKVAVLRWLDGIGRVESGPPVADSAKSAQHSVSDAE